MATERDVLACVGGFVRPGRGHAHGTDQAAHLLCKAIAATEAYRGIDVYQEIDRLRSLALPPAPAVRVFDKTVLPWTRTRYPVIYVANGEQMTSAPHVLRPQDDWAPVVCSVGTTHDHAQWMNLFVSITSGAVRSTDGFIFKAQATARLFRQTWEAWTTRFHLRAPYPAVTEVIPNGVDVQVERHVPAARKSVRQRLRVAEDDVVYLAFSRLSPASKGDLQALVVRWRDVLARVPRALLVVSGAVVDPHFAADLRFTARAAGVGDRVLVLDNPMDLLEDGRTGLMSAADVFVHVSTGVEESCPNVILEAMAHGLPVISSAWAGAPALVEEGLSGYLADTLHAPVAPAQAASVFGMSDIVHARIASRAVCLDWAAVIRAAEALADDAHRGTMGRAARARAEAHDAHRIARRYLDFFGRAARAAEEAWQGPRRFRPLVALDDVLAAQATAGLSLDTEVRLGERGRAELLTTGLQVEDAGAVASLLAACNQQWQPLRAIIAGVRAAGKTGVKKAPASAQQTATPSEEGPIERQFAAHARLIVRALNLGLLEHRTNQGTKKGADHVEQHPELHPEQRELHHQRGHRDARAAAEPELDRDLRD